MKFSSFLIASVLALSTMAQAAEEVSSEDAALSEDEMTDLQVECVEQGIAAEVEDDQMDAFVDQCVNENLASRKTSKDKKG